MAAALNWLPTPRICYPPTEEGILGANGIADGDVRCFRDSFPAPVFPPLFCVEMPITDGSRPGTCEMEKVPRKNRAANSRLFDSVEHPLEYFLAPQWRQSARHGCRTGNLAVARARLGVDIWHSHGVQPVWKRKIQNLDAGMVLVDVLRFPDDLHSAI